VLTTIGTYRLNGNQRSTFVCKADLPMTSASFVDLNPEMLGDPLHVLGIETTLIQESKPCLWQVTVGNGVFETMALDAEQRGDFTC
jgi:hypothetical protein